MSTQDTSTSDNIVDSKNIQPRGYEMKLFGILDLPVVQGSGPITTPGNYPCPWRKDLKGDKASPMNKMKLVSVKKRDLIKVLKEGKTWIWIAWIASLVALVGVLGFHLLYMNKNNKIHVLYCSNFRGLPFGILSPSHEQIPA